MEGIFLGEHHLKMFIFGEMRYFFVKLFGYYRKA